MGPSTRAFQLKDETKLEDTDKKVGPGTTTSLDHSTGGRSPNQQLGPGSTLERDEMDNIRNPSQESGPGNMQVAETSISSQNPNQQSGSGSTGRAEEDSDKTMMKPWDKKYSKVGPQLGPILDEGQKRVRRPPQRYGVYSVSATVVADLTDKEIRILDDDE